MILNCKSQIRKKTKNKRKEYFLSINSNRIEGTWAHLKKYSKLMFGVPKENF